jgi:hypothetical protein
LLRIRTLICALLSVFVITAPVGAVEFPQYVTGLPAITPNAGDFVPVTRGGAEFKSSITNIIAGAMQPSASNAILPDARINILPFPTNGNCLVGDGVDWVSSSCSGATGMAVNASNALLPDARTNLGASVTGGIWPGSLGGTGINNGSRTITYGGNLTFSGAGPTTFTVPSSAANFTFPSATSTLMDNAAVNASLPNARTNIGSWPPVSATKDLGFVGNGLTDNSALLSTLKALSSSPTVYFPAGTYMIGCPSIQTMQSAISLVGDGQGITTLKLSAACALPSTNIFAWVNKSGVRISGLTLDLNNATSAALNGIIAFNAVSNSRIDHVSVINGGTNMLLLNSAAGAGGSSNITIEDNYLALSSPSTTQNECINTSASGGGGLTNYHIQRNVCVNTAMELSMSYSDIRDNEISGWAFGSGITVNQDTSTHNLVISGNNIHDSAVTFDVNSTYPSGIEAYAADSVVSSNTCNTLASVCVVYGGQRSAIVGNQAYGMGKRNDAHGAAGFSAFYVNATYNCNGCLFASNTASDDGSGDETYGYQDVNSTSSTVTIIGNNFSGNAVGTVQILGAGHNVDNASVGALPPLWAQTAVVATPGGNVGHSYTPGSEIINFGGGTTPSPARLLIVSTQLSPTVLPTIAAAGSSGTPGACVLTGTTGTGTKFQINSTIGGGGGLSSIGSIVVGGSYTVNPTDVTQEPVTGCSLSGAKLAINMGANTGRVLYGGAYSILPSNPVSQQSSTASGTGATWTVAWKFAPGVLADGSGGVAGNNTALGDTSQVFITTGVANTAFGTNANLNVTTGNNNTAVGALANDSVSTGSQNIAVGFSANKAVVNGSNNVAVGYKALTATTNNNNVGIGGQAGDKIVGGGSNTILGNDVASTTLVSGSNNLLIGTSSAIDTAAAGTSNTIGIGAGGACIFCSTGTNTPSTSVSTISGILNVAGAQLTDAGTIRTTGQNTTGFTGSGGEFAWTGSATELRSYDRTGVAVAPLSLVGSTLALSLTGNATISGGGTWTGLAAPVNASDAATKAYADSIAAGITVHTAAQAATTANLTYTQSGTGVGATLTNAGAKAAFAVDGYTASASDRILVKDLTTTKYNGIYTVTTVGDGSTNWVLTRATDFDQASAAEVAAGASVIVVNGTTNAHTNWVETGQGPFTVDTTPIIFSEVGGGSGSGTVNAGGPNTLAYYATGPGTTVSALTTANNGILVTDGSGVPSISSTLPAAVQGNITGTGTLISGATGTGFTVALGTSTMSGVLPSANGGAGTITGALKGDGAGNVSQAACADLSNGATGCSTTVGSAATANTGTSGHTLGFLDGANTISGAQTFSSGDLILKGATSGTITLNAPNIGGTSTITLPNGTTDFSATGGTNFVVKQASTGAAFTVGSMACANLSDGATGCSTTVGTAATAATGTSAHTVPFLDGINTWSARQTFGAILSGGRTVSGTTDTLAATDCGTTVQYTSGSSVAVTLPNNVVAGPPYCFVNIVQEGAGQITFSAAAGATLVSAHSYTKTFGIHAGVTVGVTANSGGTAAEWTLFGDGA